jgi:hypothetical protein
MFGTGGGTKSEGKHITWFKPYPVTDLDIVSRILERDKYKK